MMTDKLSLENNAAFLAANGKKAGVTTTASGLQIRTLVPGSGKKPGPTQSVTVHYEGKLIDDSVFDSSFKRKQPATIPTIGTIDPSICAKPDCANNVSMAKPSRRLREPRERFAGRSH